MLASLVLAAALTAQLPRPAAPPADAPTSQAQQRRKLIAKRRARASARYVHRVNQEALEAQQQARAAAAARAEYQRTLPMRLELRRQNLAAQANAVRNAELHRYVSAVERSAGYAYPGQSPTQGIYPR